MAYLLRLLQQNYVIGGDFNGALSRAVCTGNCSTETFVRNHYHIRGRISPLDPSRGLIWYEALLVSMESKSQWHWHKIKKVLKEW
jgi:hypothetical protein